MGLRTWPILVICYNSYFTDNNQIHLNHNCVVCLIFHSWAIPFNLDNVSTAQVVLRTQGVPGFPVLTKGFRKILSTIAMIIRAPGVILRQFLVVLLFISGLGQNCVLGG